jgi:hypothetical protein
MSYTNLNSFIPQLVDRSYRLKSGKELYNALATQRTLYYRYFKDYEGNISLSSNYKSILSFNGSNRGTPDDVLDNNHKSQETKYIEAKTRVESSFTASLQNIRNNTTNGSVSLTSAYYCPYEYEMTSPTPYKTGQAVFKLKDIVDITGNITTNLNSLKTYVNSNGRNATTCATKYNLVFTDLNTLMTKANFFIPNQIPTTAPVISSADIDTSGAADMASYRITQTKIDAITSVFFGKISVMIDTLESIRRNSNFTSVNNAAQPKYDSSDKRVDEIFDMTIQALNESPLVLYTKKTFINPDQYDSITRNRDYIDGQLNELHQMPGSKIDSYSQLYTGTMVAGAMWTILATSLVYYVFTEL